MPIAVDQTYSLIVSAYYLLSFIALPENQDIAVPDTPNRRRDIWACLCGRDKRQSRHTGGNGT